MSYEASKQEAIKEILENPARFVMEHFKEGDVFPSGAYDLDASALEDLPVIMRLTADNNTYVLKVASWWLRDPYYREIEYCVYAKKRKAGEPLEWEHACHAYDEVQLFRGNWSELEQAVVGMSANKWREITVDNMRCTPDGRYAWFFPCGLKPAMRRDGMSMHVNNRPNK